jgi:ribonuclease HI
MKIEVFTDGGCIGNPGPGAWAYVIDDRNGRIEGSGYNPETTNNRMELTAVIEVLSFLRESAGSDAEQSRQFVIHTDSQYVKNGITNDIAVSLLQASKQLPSVSDEQEKLYRSASVAVGTRRKIDGVTCKNRSIEVKAVSSRREGY